jgi:hypothetical protein
MPQRFLSIKNYEKYQTSSVKKGNRPWIKLYKSILSDPEFMKLSTHSRFLYTGLLLLADDCNNRIYNDRTYIGQRLYIPHTEVNLTPLYRAGFLYASNLSRVLSEESREEEKREEETKAEASPLRATVVVDSEWIQDLGNNPAYAHINLSVEIGKMEAWLALPKNAKRHKTRSFILNWLNKIEGPMQSSNGKVKPPPFPPKGDPIARGQWRQTYGDPRQYGYD